MRVLLVQTAHGLNAPSGGYRSNLGFLRQLRSYGHTVAQTCYAFDEEIKEAAFKAGSKGVNPKVQPLPAIDLGTDPKTGRNRQVSLTRFVDENNVLNIVVSRTMWKLYPHEEQTVDQKGYLEVILASCPLLEIAL